MNKEWWKSEKERDGYINELETLYRALPGNLKINAVKVDVPYMPYITMLPENWELHALWRYQEERDASLRMFADPEDNGDENRD